jgi:transketolase
LDREVFTSASGLQRGAYILADLGEGLPEIILMASGSEVSLIIEAGKRLAAEGVNVRLISFPSWELFAAQDQEYKDSVLMPNVQARLSIEAGISQGWDRWVGDRGTILSIERYGASAPYETIYEKLGLSVENVVNNAKGIL